MVMMLKLFSKGKVYMFGVVDLETVISGDMPNGNAVKDTWLLRLPKDICDKEGFAE